MGRRESPRRGPPALAFTMETDYRVIAPLVAKDAGIGLIGAWAR